MHNRRSERYDAVPDARGHPGTGPLRAPVPVPLSLGGGQVLGTGQNRGQSDPVEVARW